MIRWLFLDMGWTLVDETRAHRYRWQTVSELLRQWNRRLSEAELASQAEWAATRFEQSPFRAVVDALGLPGHHYQTLMNTAVYPKEREELYPETPAVLSQLQSRYKLAVVANQPAGTESRLDFWGIRGCFSAVVVSAEAGLSKPDSMIFLHALEIAGCRSGEAVVVGDRLDNDIGPAKRLGCTTVRVLQGPHRFQEPRNGHEVPDLTLQSIAQLPEALTTIELSRG